jgi:alpha,alpha-trehalase
MKKPILAALCDLDGVITNTANIHAQAWQETFDHFFWQLQHKTHYYYPPFNIVDDYRTFLDGKPRLAGIKDYLRAKNIYLPAGQETDEDGDTLYSLANQKSQRFLQLLEQQGVEAYPENLHKLQEWKQQGMKLAVVSASKNCRQILKLANLDTFFEVCVDGLVAEQKQLRGKPYPDTFLYAAKELNIHPHEAMVVEDALAGITAAKAGGFGLAVGLICAKNYTVMQDADADVLINDLSELMWDKHVICYPVEHKSLINARHHIDKLSEMLSHHQLAIFLDYDGTLAPIVAHPEAAIISDGMREALARLSQQTKVSIISGRDNETIRQFVKLPNIRYIGDHGLDIDQPDGIQTTLTNTSYFIPLLQNISKQLSQALGSIAGVQLEPKKYDVAVHYRSVKKEDQRKVIKTTEQIVQQYTDLKIMPGKKVLDIYPNIEWDKGKALQWILWQLQLERSTIYPLYIGDDLTDEDAFRALPAQGIGILVGDHGEKTYADLWLEDVTAVEKFLYALIKTVNSHEKLATRL